MPGKDLAPSESLSRCRGVAPQAKLTSSLLLLCFGVFLGRGWGISWLSAYGQQGECPELPPHVAKAGVGGLSVALDAAASPPLPWQEPPRAWASPTHPLRGPGTGEEMLPMGAAGAEPPQGSLPLVLPHGALCVWEAAGGQDPGGVTGNEQLMG